MQRRRTNPVAIAVCVPSPPLEGGRRRIQPCRYNRAADPLSEDRPTKRESEGARASFSLVRSAVRRRRLYSVTGEGHARAKTEPRELSHGGRRCAPDPSLNRVTAHEAVSVAAAGGSSSESCALSSIAVACGLKLLRHHRSYRCSIIRKPNQVLL
ncbi:uncharacterized protein [Arachis hypogaea]|uniref:uncharacterized protein n=1 Tax=Arachis hypogaea TaxID=3818 RepID=UPI000A2C3673|nr:uncharacterized protein LOC112794403 isoform X2 [Arachis hypogaea]QHO39413.1 uncharacterized protein DS421_4g128950 [Arachis hypogaea]